MILYKQVSNKTGCVVSIIQIDPINHFCVDNLKLIVDHFISDDGKSLIDPTNNEEFKDFPKEEFYKLVMEYWYKSANIRAKVPLLKILNAIKAPFSYEHLIDLFRPNGNRPSVPYDFDAGYDYDPDLLLKSQMDWDFKYAGEHVTDTEFFLK